MFEVGVLARGVLCVAVVVGLACAQTEVFAAVDAFGAVLVVHAPDALVDGIDAGGGFGFAGVAIAAYAVIGTHEDFGTAVVVDVGDDRAFDRGMGTLARAEEDFSRLAVIDAREAFVGIDGFGLSVAVKIEQGRAGCPRSIVLRPAFPHDVGVGTTAGFVGLAFGVIDAKKSA